MPTTQTRLTIYNGALDLISEFPITTVQDENIYARWLNRNYSLTVEAALRLDAWNFATRFYMPVEDPEPPMMRWRKRFGLPPDWVRILQPTRDGYRTGYPIPYAIQGNYLMVNETPRKGIEYIANLQEPGEWDPLFAQMLKAQLATAMAQRFTAKNSYIDRAVQLANQAKEQASEINAFEGSVPPPEAHDIIRARHNDDPYRNDGQMGAGSMSDWY
jgi:hypothetical protein